MAIKSVVRSICACFSFVSFNANAYIISYDMGLFTLGENASVSLSSNELSIADSFDQYTEATWEIVSAEEDGNGGVNVSYDQRSTFWETYNTNIYLPFTILADNSNSPTSEEVKVKTWGEIDLYREFYSDPISGNSVCCSDNQLFVEYGGSFFAAPGEYEGSPGYGFQTLTMSGTLDETITLLTNTEYYVQFKAVMLLEAQTGQRLPDYFASWNDYNAFVNQYGSSGKAYTSAEGFMNFSMAIVPEPPIILLLGSGFIGIIGLARRKA